MNRQEFAISVVFVLLCIDVYDSLTKGIVYITLIPALILIIALLIAGLLGRYPRITKYY